MVDERITLTIDENGTISCKTDGFDHSTMDSMDLLDAVLKDLVDELPEEKLTKEGKKSKAGMKSKSKTSKKQRLEGGTK
jgi:hypothetical protein|tara:strand:- start:41 stop:277 length:237 start_codon:yes stop_codon:yes gene_type:complete